MFNVGDKVTCKTPVEAYYSRYGGSPEVIFSPGMVGTVNAIDCIPPRGRKTFCCIDFDGPKYMKTSIWRVALTPDNMVEV